MPRVQRDLVLPSPFVSNDDAFWSSSKPIEEIYDLLESQAQVISEWYMFDRRRKRAGARALRMSSIVLTTVGALVPLLSPMVSSVDPRWGYVFVGVAAGMVAVDRYFGFSSGWMRDMDAVMDLNQAAQAFRFDWAALALTQGVDDAERAHQQLGLLRRYSSAQARILAGETRRWAEQLRARIDEVDLNVQQSQSPKA